jgi:hypothetical protein
MKRLLRVAFFLAAGLFTAASAHAATYYIDFAGGSDSNNGTSKISPWKHAPGMVGCVATCGTTPRPGDSFILKGGVTWPNAVFTWVWTWSGTAANRIYIGNDGTFGTGRPILDAEGVTAGANNNMWNQQGNYVTFDNVEMKGMKHLADNFGNNNFVKWNTTIFPILSNVYVHGWIENGSLDTLTFLIASTQYPALNTGGILEYNTVDGSDTASAQADINCTGACQGSLNAVFGSVPTFRFNTVRYVSNGFIGAGDDVHDNLWENIRDSLSPTAHENAFENNGSCGTKFYNNVIRHVKAGVTVFLAERAGCTGHAYNNVIYDTTAGNVFNIDIPLAYAGCGTPDSLGKCPGGTQYTLNNTIECGPDSGPTNVCISAAPGSSLGYKYLLAVTQNNHLITSNVAPITCNATTCTTSNNIAQTKAQANAQGMNISQAYAFTPGAGDAPVDAGADLSSVCVTVPGVCVDTTYGTAARSTNVRPQPVAGTFDAGAYELPSAGSGAIATLSTSALTCSSARPGVTTGCATLTLQNTGDALLTISSIAINATTPFVRTHDCTTLAAAATCTITVTFSPVAAGAATQRTLTVTSDGGNPTCTLDGTGLTIPSSPLRVAWNTPASNGTAVTKSSIALVGVPQ